MPVITAKMPFNSISDIMFTLNNRYPDIDITITAIAPIKNSIRPHPTIGSDTGSPVTSILSSIIWLLAYQLWISLPSNHYRNL